MASIDVFLSGVEDKGRGIAARVKKIKADLRSGKRLHTPSGNVWYGSDSGYINHRIPPNRTDGLFRAAARNHNEETFFYIIVHSAALFTSAHVLDVSVELAGCEDLHTLVDKLLSGERTLPGIKPAFRLMSDSGPDHFDYVADHFDYVFGMLVDTLRDTYGIEYMPRRGMPRQQV